MDHEDDVWQREPTVQCCLCSMGGGQYSSCSQASVFGRDEHFSLWTENSAHISKQGSDSESTLPGLL